MARPRYIRALRVHQWLPSWNSVEYSPDKHRAKPQDHFYLFTLRASELKALSGIQQRTTEGGLLRSEDLGIQRKHDRTRSEEIHRFVESGFPWSDLSEAKRATGEFEDLRKPGWLPTAIVVNILRKGESRRGFSVADKDLIEIQDRDDFSYVALPAEFSGTNWKVEREHIPPIEVIDGQHRLGAFVTSGFAADYELPVVAFHGLDISWQAYLFYTINIKPKKINPSLAFDMYPLLRTEDWLERFQGHSVYRESRAQELTEALWSYPESPWYQRINMLGEAGRKGVSQSAWVRSLMATYVRPYDRGRIGGLFGAGVGSDDLVLPWGRAQQAAFLIYVWQRVKEEILKVKPESEFSGDFSLLNQDQGVRGVLYVSNDLCYLNADELELRRWLVDENAAASDHDAISTALTTAGEQQFASFIILLAAHLAKFDWRSSSDPALNQDLRLYKSAFRGSGGYSMLRRELVNYLREFDDEVGIAAADAGDRLNY